MYIRAHMFLIRKKENYFRRAPFWSGCSTFWTFTETNMPIANQVLIVSKNRLLAPCWGQGHKGVTRSRSLLYLFIDVLSFVAPVLDSSAPFHHYLFLPGRYMFKLLLHLFLSLLFLLYSLFPSFFCIFLLIKWKIQNTVKPVLSGFSKRPKLVFKINYPLMQVKSIAECCRTLDLHQAFICLKDLYFVLFLSGHLKQV